MKHPVEFKILSLIIRLKRKHGLALFVCSIDFQTNRDQRYAREPNFINSDNFHSFEYRNYNSQFFGGKFQEGHKRKIWYTLYSIILGFLSSKVTHLNGLLLHDSRIYRANNLLIK